MKKTIQLLRQHILKYGGRKNPKQKKPLCMNMHIITNLSQWTNEHLCQVAAAPCESPAVLFLHSPLTILILSTHTVCVSAWRQTFPIDFSREKCYPSWTLIFRIRPVLNNLQLLLAERKHSKTLYFTCVL